MTRRSFRPSPIAQAMAIACAALALPATAGIVTLGDVNPDPSSGSVGSLTIGNTAVGSVKVDGGSGLTAERLVLGGSPSGNGGLTVTGAGSKTTVSFANGGNVDVGSAGTGSLSVLDGATFVYGGTGTSCQANCRIFVSNGAGSSGSLLVSGIGSALSTVGGVIIGNASMFTQAADGFSFGTPGGASTGSAQVGAGGTVTSSSLSIAQPGGGSARTGTESTVGSVVVDGLGSAWNLVRNAAQTGARALLSIATGRNTNGSLEVRNGATMRLDGSDRAGEYAGINVAAPLSGTLNQNQSGSLKVSGPGSRIDVEGGIGFLNVGRGIGTTASLTIANGGLIAGNGTETGLIYVQVGAGGSSGTATVDGAGSLLRMNGRNSLTNSDPTAILGGGAFLSVGRGGGGAAGTGTFHISNGGSVVIDTSPLALTNANGQTGLYVGAFNGSNGQMTVDGAGSSLLITAGSGMAPIVGIGRDAATGSLSITGGGRMEVSSTHSSVANPGGTGYLPGDVTLFEIGRRNDGGVVGTNQGTVTVKGAGSALALTGAADALLIVGRGQGGVGALNVLDGGSVVGKALFIGQEAGSTGTLNLNAGAVTLSGVLQGGPSPGIGATLSVGRGGNGTANIANGSTVTIISTASGAGLGAAASSLIPGGSGLINVTGGSTVTIDGPSARVNIGTQATPTLAGIGILNILDTGSKVSALGTGATVQIGGIANSAGFATVGAGASLSATSLIGVAHDGTGSTAGMGSLVVNGTVTSSQLIVGSKGVVTGSGTIQANVTNHGVFNPGNSPGRLTIDGAFDNSGGTLVLEVLDLGNGQFAYDEIVFTDLDQVVMGDGSVRFVFLGDTDPMAFVDAGLFDIGTFFKTVDPSGGISDLDDSRLGLFGSVSFSAESAGFTISNLAFDPKTGAGSLAAAAVPLPATVALVMLGLAGLRLHRRRGS